MVNFPAKFICSIAIGFELEKTEHVHPVKAAKTVLQEGVIAAKKG